MQGKPDKTRLLFIIDGVLINAALVLTTGVFLSGYVVYLGGSDFTVGLLNNSLIWASILALFSFLVFERLEKRKAFLLALLAISRLLVCSTIFLPLILGKDPVVLQILTLMVVLGHVLWGVFSVGASIWMMSSFSDDTRSPFIFRRVFWIRISFTLITIIMGMILDWSGKSYAGFLIVFLASFALSLADAVILLNIREPDNKIAKDARWSVASFFAPLADKNYRSFLIFIFLFYTSLTLSSSFTPLYLIRYLKFDYTFMSVTNVITYFFMIVCTSFWNKLESKKGLMFVFKLTGLIAIIEFLIYGFLTTETYYLLYIASVFAGIGDSGFNIFIINYRYELMPERNRTLYEGWFGALYGLSMLVGPAIGNWLMNRLPVFQNQVFQHSKFQFMYIFSFILAAGALLLVFKSRRTISDE